jgi:hypothetical protein
MRKLLTAFTLALVLVLMSASAVLAGDLADDKVVVGDDYTLAEGERIDGNLIVLGGNVIVEDGGTVDGNLVVFGGDVTLSGAVTQDMVVFGGSADLSSTAVVEGELVTSGGSISREPGSEVKGGETEGVGPRFGPPFNLVSRTPGPLDFFINFVWDSFRVLLTAVTVAVLALLVTLLLPDQTARVSAAIATAPVLSGFLGLLFV